MLQKKMKQLKLFETNTPEPKEAQEDQFLKDCARSNPLLGDPSPEMGYEKYLKSDEWRHKTRFAKYKRDYTCQHCKKTNCILQVHHKHYDTLYEECLLDVEVLCKKCHKKADRKRKYITALHTWAENKHGVNWHYLSPHFLEAMEEEFAEWWHNGRHEEW
jgi:hypothetical protein